MLVLVAELENGHSIIVDLIASYQLHLTDSEDGQSLVFKFAQQLSQFATLAHSLHNPGSDSSGL